MVTGTEVFLMIPLYFAILGLWVWSVVWVYKDADKRGKSPALVALLVAIVSWPLSLLAWLVFRPEIKVSETETETSV